MRSAAYVRAIGEVEQTEGRAADVGDEDRGAAEPLELCVGVLENVVVHAHLHVRVTPPQRAQKALVQDHAPLVAGLLVQERNLEVRLASHRDVRHRVDRVREVAQIAQARVLAYTRLEVGPSLANAAGKCCLYVNVSHVPLGPRPWPRGGCNCTAKGFS